MRSENDANRFCHSVKRHLLDRVRNERRRVFCSDIERSVDVSLRKPATDRLCLFVRNVVEGRRATDRFIALT